VKINGKAAISLTIGNVVNVAISYAVSYVSFTFLIIKFGYIFGLLSAWALSFVVFYTMILFYAWTKKDWIGMGKIKASLNKEKHKNFISRMLVYANSKGEKIFFIALSIKLGPFTSLLYMRGPNDYSKMQKRDWQIFLLGYFITNIFCTFAVLSGLLIFKSS
jgi:hypothetical protein